ncbi:hypothetical protein A5736_01420 [Mycobacterium sp. SP-6446]|nr:hypothetical protein A5736_01420 [Mycobacterium sp. SP-6446]
MRIRELLWRIRKLLHMSNYWDEPLPIAILPPPNDPLTGAQIDELWIMFSGIAKHWRLLEDPSDIERRRSWDVELLRSRWLDMLEARSSGTPDYRGEYLNAECVFKALAKKLGGQDKAIAKIYGDTKVTEVSQATTRLAHAKFYVANDFITCFVVTGGFRRFVKDARNYTGFMGGSRFREWPPVRTGAGN